MKVCAFKEKVIDYFEGCIPAEDKAIFESHLKDCSVCQNELSALKKLREIMDEDIVNMPGKEFFDRLREKIRQQELAVKRPRWGILGILIPVLSVLIIFVFLNLKKDRFVEITINTFNLSQDKYLNALLLDRVIDDEISIKLGALEEYFSGDIEQGLDELTTEEEQELLKTIKDRYGGEYL